MKNLKIITLLALAGLLAFSMLGCGDGEDTDYDEVRFALSSEWQEREDGLQNFEETYDIEWPEGDQVVVELGLSYQAVAEGQAEAGRGDATEGRIPRFNLHVLEDDKGAFPAYNPAPVVRGEIMEEYPELEEEFREVSEKLDMETLQNLNKEITVDDRQPEDVAEDWLLDEGLIEEGDPEVDPDKETEIVVGGKTFPEALFFGSMTVYYLEHLGYDVVDESGLGETAVIRPALESGEVDVYWEYTGTGLFNVMNHDEVIADADECWETIRDWDKENNDLVWLDYAPANNTFVIFINEEMYEEHGWETISDMVEYVKEQTGQ